MNNRMNCDESLNDNKHWISITGKCNNNCLFCLDRGREDKFHKDFDEICRDLFENRKRGVEKLVISGGDPTIHPDVIRIVRYSKEIGYRKVQVVTNGRLFSSAIFTKNILSAGLDEVTFSIHGLNSKMHDSLTRVPGSFKQIIKGIRNVQASGQGIIINTDTCITKMNYSFLPHIVRFISERLGIMEVNLMSMVPQGNAWRHRGEILYDYSEVSPYVKKAIDYSVKKGIVIWLSRFPARYLEGYEGHIESPYKLVDEVRGRGEKFFIEGNVDCKGERCRYCSLQPICEGLLEYHNPSESRRLYDEVIHIRDGEILPKIIEKNKRYLLVYSEPVRDLSKYQVQIIPIEEALNILKRLDYDNVFVKGIPICILRAAGINHIGSTDSIHFDIGDYRKAGRFMDFAERMALNSMTLSEKCRDCKYEKSCKGIYINYARIKGFGDIKQILPSENFDLNIGKACNNNCMFCMTKGEGDEYMVETGRLLTEIYGLKTKYKRITFLGGEPTIHPQILNIVRAAAEIGFSEIHIVTNGRKLSDEEFLDSLIVSGVNMFSVSFHSHIEGIENNLTGRECYSEKLKGLDNILQKKNIRVHINIVVNVKNLPTLSDSIRFFEDKGVAQIRLNSMMIHSGNSRKNRDGLIARLKEIGPILDQIDSDRVIFGDFPPCIFKNPRETMKKIGEYGLDCRTRNIFFDDEFKMKSDFIWKERKIGRLKSKRKVCGTCSINEICEGFWNDYLEIYGDDELRPVV